MSSVNQTPAILAEIVEHKRLEVERAKSLLSFAELRGRALAEPPPRELAAAVRRGPADRTSVIAEIKRMSPSKGLIRAEIKRMSPSAGLIRPEYAGEGFLPEGIAQRYHACGASAISCLTDEKFFGGHLSYIERVRLACPLPVLRKDFLIDPWQVWESRAAGADAVLLIAECLPGGELEALLEPALALGMSVLVEVHDRENLERVLPVVEGRERVLLGVNSRDLRTMRVDLGHAMALAALVADRSSFVAESGIRTPHDLARLREAGVRIALVGEHLMRQSDPGLALRALFGGAGADETLPDPC
ncbi:MAG: indole-3-glycerol phosphate synthase TrpC [Phycisphaerales bacterium]